MRHHLILSATLSWLALTTSACNARTKVGSECVSGKCTAPVACGAATQQLPIDCRNPARTCTTGSVIAADQQACTECGLTNERIGVKNTPLAACACAHCAAQIAACFDSANTEPGGGDATRDTLCRVIVECGWAYGCAGGECYCGEGVDRVTCLEDASNGTPRGPCAGTIEGAVLMLDSCADSETIGACVLANQLMADTILARATAVAHCVTGDPLFESTVIEAKCPRDSLASQ